MTWWTVIEDMLGRMREMERRVARLETLEAAQQFIMAGEPTVLTIAAGVVTVTPTKSFFYVATEASAATDDLDTINGGVDGQIIVLHSATSAEDPTLKDYSDNLALAGDFTLDHILDSITLIYEDTLGKWLEISRSDNY